MSLFGLEHGRAAYFMDFVFYAAVELVLAGLLWHSGGREPWPSMAGLALMGLAFWTLTEYVMHRYVLHGVRPFSRWHGEHHQRPMALISAPTLLSAGLIAALVFLPALALLGLERSCALTFGFLTGYLGFSATHHAVHHWRADAGWLRRRKHWHAMHHRLQSTGHFGVTTAFWDLAFGSAGTGDHRNGIKRVRTDAGSGVGALGDIRSRLKKRCHRGIV